MIFDKLSNKEAYKDMKNLYKVLCEMEKHSEPIAEKIVIEQDNVFINPVSLTTKPVSECLFEAHKNFIDVHCVLSGAEYISVQDLQNLKVATPHNEQNDCGFYDGISAANFCLQKGWFLVCFTHDAHRVAENGGTSQKVEKLVGKIRA